MDIRQLRRKALVKAKQKVREKKAGRDYAVIQAVEAIDELDDIANIMTERVRNWYAFHYPELSKLVRSVDTYLEIITVLKGRKDMRVAALTKYLPEAQAKKVELIAEQTMGADLSDTDLESIAKFASLAAHAHKEREELAQYVDDTTEDICPNMKSLVGGLLSARLIAKAGSLERLAEMPASTVQVLGAEKALFAHIKKGVKPPKHGLIFAYPAIHQAPKNRKGKISRVVAGKLAIAARMDFFKHGLDKTLAVELEKKIAGALK
ncbi:NOP5/NOP56 family protein [archaeon]